jgi:hypothetical protein
MGDVPDFIKEDQAEVANTPPTLTDLVPLILRLKEELAAVAQLEVDLELAKQTLKRTQRDEIPQIMNYLGYSELTLSTKEKVKVKQDASVTIPEDKEPLFFKYLADTNQQDIIKLQFAFPRMPAERRQYLFNLLEANDFEYEFKEGVHWQIQQAFFKKLLGIGQDDREEGIKSGKYVHPDKVKDFAEIFVFFTTSITAPKGDKGL